MKKGLKHIGAGLMLVVLIAVSSGFTLFSHMCFMSGGHEVSAQKIESCCAPESNDGSFLLKSHCCDDEVSFIKFDITTLIAKYQVQNDLLTSFVMILPDNIISDESNTSTLAFINLPPPKSGRDILSEKQVFRI